MQRPVLSFIFFKVALRTESHFLGESANNIHSYQVLSCTPPKKSSISDAASSHRKIDTNKVYNQQKKVEGAAIKVGWIRLIDHHQPWVIQPLGIVIPIVVFQTTTTSFTYFIHSKWKKSNPHVQTTVHQMTHNYSKLQSVFITQTQKANSVIKAEQDTINITLKVDEIAHIKLLSWWLVAFDDDGHCRFLCAVASPPKFLRIFLLSQVCDFLNWHTTTKNFLFAFSSYLSCKAFEWWSEFDRARR